MKEQKQSYEAVTICEHVKPQAILKTFRTTAVENNIFVQRCRIGLRSFSGWPCTVKFFFKPAVAFTCTVFVKSF